MGKHAKKTKRSAYAKTAGLTCGGLLLPLAWPGTASAATEEEWDTVAQCESGGDWSIDYSGDGLSVGGLQFQSPSWQAALSYLNEQGYDTSTWPQGLYQGMPDVPGKYETVLAAEALLHIQGSGAWVCSGVYSSSMFDGGPTPAVVAGGATSTPAVTDSNAVRCTASFFGGEEDAQPMANGGSTPPTMDGVALWDVPFGTDVTITSEETGLSVTAPVVDRGPGDGPLSNGVCIDLLPGTWDALGVSRDQGLQEVSYVIGDGTSEVVPNSPDNGGSQVYDDHVHHTVVPGDTLYDITKLYTGDASDDNWKHTYEINKATVGDNPHLIFPGQDIRVDTQADDSQPEPSQPEPSEPSHTSYVHPVGGADVSQVYGNPGSNYTLGYHTGVDFSASSGTETVAVAAGTVVSSDTSSAYGTNVQIQLADGRYALYAHLSGATVSPGDEVAPGDLVGYVGNTGTSSGPHLHFEIRTAPKFAEGNFLDPIQYLRDSGLVI